MLAVSRFVLIAGKRSSAISVARLRVMHVDFRVRNNFSTQVVWGIKRSAAASLSLLLSLAGVARQDVR